MISQPLSPKPQQTFVGALPFYFQKNLNKKMKVNFEDIKQQQKKKTGLYFKMIF